MPKVVIIGAGFGGLNAAKELGRVNDFEVLLIDRRNHHLFQPLLYQVATAGLSPAEIAIPVRDILSSYKRVRVLMGEVTHIELEEKKVKVLDKEYEYDFLIVACGASHSYFGKNNWEDYAPGIKTLEQATEIRRRILLSFEKAELETSTEKQRRLLSFVVVGGGPTGVEMAGAIAEISRKTLVRDFSNIDPSRSRVVLIEAGPRILPAMSEKLSKRATDDLEEMGVTVWTHARVTEINQQGVHMGSDYIGTENVVWAAGVEPSQLSRSMPVEKDNLGRVKVGPDLSLDGYPDVFVIGDAAHFLHKEEALPGLAPVATQQGRYVGQLLQRKVKGKKSKPFQYLDKGMMATIGRKRAVVSVGNWSLNGMLAWLAWLFIHVYYLIGFKNKVFVLMSWAWSYFTFKKSARLILSKDWKEH